MNATETPVGPSLDETDPDDAGVHGRPRRLAFWICRYLPAEIVGTAAMVFAGLAITAVTDNPALIALAALLGETLGFYGVLGITVYGEQSGRLQNVGRGRTLLRTLALLLAEFGPSELLDSFLLRPAALVLGVLLLGPLWGMIAGKVVADIVFYAIAAGAYLVTERTGLRDASARTPSTASSRPALSEVIS